jgi:hypothetical protein
VLGCIPGAKVVAALANSSPWFAKEFRRFTDLSIIVVALMLLWFCVVAVSRAGLVIET